LQATTEHATWVSLTYSTALFFPFIFFKKKKKKVAAAANVDVDAAEEVQYASLNVPRSMIFTMLMNGVMGFAIILVILFCIGDVESVMSTPTGWPFIQLLYNAVGSKAATTILTSLLCSMFIFATFGFLASTSRQTWAFARDRGLPFSEKFARVCYAPFYFL
jgi:amino acid transporter